MERYSEIFSLRDIFNDKSLGNKLPIVNYRDIYAITPEGSKLYTKTTMHTVRTQVFNGAIMIGKMFYHPLETIKSGDMLILDGEIEDQDACITEIVDYLNGMKPLLSFTANNADMIRSALKENEKNKRKYGLDCKMKLRVQSKMEISGMNSRQLINFMNDVMSNIMFSGNYPQTAKKYGVYNMNFNGKTYVQMQQEWQRRVNG